MPYVRAGCSARPGCDLEAMRRRSQLYRPPGFVNAGKTYLHEAAHDTIAEEQLVAFQCHARDNGVEGPFATLGNK